MLVLAGALASDGAVASDGVILVMVGVTQVTDGDIQVMVGDTLVTVGGIQVMVGVTQVGATRDTDITETDMHLIMPLAEEVTTQEATADLNQEDEALIIIPQIQQDEVLMHQIIARGIQLVEIAAQDEVL